MENITKKQFLILVAAMKAAYPSEKFLPDDDAGKIWYMMLKDIDYQTLTAAVQKHMMMSPYPPTIADLRKYSVQGVEQMSELAAWSLVRQAISNSSYHAEEEYSKLPPLIQKAVGNPANLREMARMDMDTVNSVEQSHFIRVYRATVKRETELLQLSPEMRELIGEKETLMIGAEE